MNHITVVLSSGNRGLACGACDYCSALRDAVVMTPRPSTAGRSGWLQNRRPACGAFEARIRRGEVPQVVVLVVRRCCCRARQTGGLRQPVLPATAIAGHEAEID